MIYSAGRLLRYLAGPAPLLVSLFWTVSPAAAQQAIESSAAQGIVGVSQVAPGGEIKVYHAHLEDLGFPPGAPTPFFGSPTVNGAQVAIVDLSIATGITSADFQQMNLYLSTDQSLDTGDSFINSVSPVNIGTITVVDATVLPALGGSDRELLEGTPRFFILSVVMSETAALNRAFRLSASANHIGIEETGAGAVPDYLVGSMIGASDGNHIVIGDGTAVTAGGSSVSIPFGGEPAMVVLLLGSGMWVLRRRSYPQAGR